MLVEGMDVEMHMMRICGRFLNREILWKCIGHKYVIYYDGDRDLMEIVQHAARQDEIIEFI